MSDYKSKYPNLFSPLKLGNITLKHRMFFSPHWTCHWDPETGLPTSRAFNYYKERAIGGASMIVFGNGSPSPTADYYPTSNPAWYKDEMVPKMKEIVDMIHTYGIPAVAQFSHPSVHQVAFKNIAQPPLSPDEINAIDLPPWMGFVSKEMEDDEIEQFLDDCGLAAERAVAAGCDGVEVLVGHGKLPNHFFSRLLNHRTDKWGGDPTGLGEGEGRARFILEIARHLRSAVGPKINVSIRINSNDMYPGSADTNDWVKLAQMLEEDGQINYLNTTLGLYRSDYNMHNPYYTRFEPGFESVFTAKIKEAVKLPVVLAGNINSAELSESMISDGVCDLVALARGMIAEPHFVKKIMENQEEDIAPCIHCNQGCYIRLFYAASGGGKCQVNPRSGEETEKGSWTKVKTNVPKKVLIIGAGAAGMECARELAESGHKPVLYEKSDGPGGQIKLWAKLPGSNEVMDYVEWITGQLTKFNVPVHYNKELTEENVEQIIKDEKPDEIVVATGSHVDRTAISAETHAAVPGWDKPHVFTYEDIYEEGFDFDRLGDKVLVADLMNDRLPVRVLETILSEGKDVRFITMEGDLSATFLGLTAEIGIAMPGLVAAGNGQWNSKNVLAHTWISEITDKGAKLFYVFDEENPWEEEFDSIVLVPTRRQNKSLYRYLKGKNYKPYTIGDAVSPRWLMYATHDGHRVAREINS